MSKDKIGDRMKNNYENRTKQFLTRRIPTIIRLDGKAFHTYTKGLDKPFDIGLIEDMQETTKFLCKNIQGCKLGYTQSDEITLVLTDYDNLQTDAWFDYNVQKMTSVSAAMATAKFNQLRNKRILDSYTSVELLEAKDELLNHTKLAFFDSRVFQIPEKEEVVNSLIWRQQDAERNSIQMLAQSLYSQKQLHGKNTSILQDMCWKKGQNWNDLGFEKKRGSLVLKNTLINGEDLNSVDDSGSRVFEFFSDTGNYAEFNDKILEWVDIENPTIRTKWEVVETPIFSKDRNVILDLI